MVYLSSVIMQMKRKTLFKFKFLPRGGGGGAFFTLFERGKIQGGETKFEEESKDVL